MPPVIRSRYDQYKRDTQQFTTWLAQTAISLGYPVSQFDQALGGEGDDAQVLVRSAASKKNARKEARAKELAQLAREGLEQDNGNNSAYNLQGDTDVSSAFRSTAKIDVQMLLEIKKVKD